MQLLRDLWLVVKVYPLAKACVLSHSDSKYIGPITMQIAYNEMRTKIVKSGICSEDKIVGAVVYIAISLAYLFNKKY